MYVLFVSRTSKVFHARKIVSDASYDPPNYEDVSVVDDSIEGWLDTVAEITRIAKEEGWRNYEINVEQR